MTTISEAAKKLERKQKKLERKKVKAIQNVKKASKAFRKAMKQYFFVATGNHAGEIKLTEKQTIMLQKESGFNAFLITMMTEAGMKAKAEASKTANTVSIDKLREDIAKSTTAGTGSELIG